MLREQCAALFDRGDEAVARSAVLDRGNHRGNGGFPDFRVTFALMPRIGDDLGIALGDGGKDQHAGAALGEMQALRQELAHCLSMRAAVHRLLRHDAKPHAGNDSIAAATMKTASCSR